MTNLNAINKLNGELKDTKDEYKKLIVAHLIKRIKDDGGLGNDVAQDGKTLDGCLDYIRTEARKHASGGVAVIEDSKVYEWAEDYYRSDVVEKAPAKPTAKPTSKAPAKPKKPTPVPASDQVSLFDDGIIDETDDLWLF